MRRKLVVLVALASGACTDPSIRMGSSEPGEPKLELCASVDLSSLAFEGVALRDDHTVTLTNTADCEIVAAYEVEAQLDDPHAVFELDSNEAITLEPARSSTFVLRFVGEEPGQFEAQLLLELSAEFGTSTRRVQLFAELPAPQE